MKRIVLITILLFTVFIYCIPTAAFSQVKATSKDPNNQTALNRLVAGRTVISDDLPKIQIKIGSKFKYLGHLEMNAMGGKAKAEQFVFSETKKGRLTRAVIVHFEEFRPTNDSTFEYPRLKMVTLGKNEYLNQTWPIKNAEILRRPEIKAVLEQIKVTAEADWVMNRYVRAVDESKKHEIILFYLEAGSLIPVPVADLAPRG